METDRLRLIIEKADDSWYYGFMITGAAFWPGIWLPGKTGVEGMKRKYNVSRKRKEKEEEFFA